ncbi:unnamed protein product [Trichogramma brassicae]|uniref:Uncharacterized protein n=1 Tax=Trichogramma brassicae TaxID=86971 RepID=A0A6H5IDW5_9HYME|nr:unnamed protein product [Trichogramma brassicae]
MYLCKDAAHRFDMYEFYLFKRYMWIFLSTSRFSQSSWVARSGHQRTYWTFPPPGHSHYIPIAVTIQRIRQE